MGRRWRRLLAALAIGLPALAAAQDPNAEALRDAMRGVLQADEAYRRNDLAAIRLEREIASLDRLLRSGQLNAAGVGLAHYWRARAYAAQNWVRLKKGEAPDRALARRTLADLDVAIATGDVENWNLTRANTQYMAGSVAFNHLDDARLAIAYWGKCAAQEHAGCLNVMATARLTGMGGVAVDLDQAVALNRRVYDTGTDFQCAGAYSALAIAQVVHTGRLPGVTVDEFEWLRRAYQLLDELAARDRDDNPCDRAKFEIYEYLMRLKKGEDRRALLRAAAARRQNNSYAPLAEYLLGTASAEVFERAAAATPLRHVACTLRHGAAWHASLRGDPAAWERHRAAMRALGAPCAAELALALPPPAKKGS